MNDPLYRELIMDHFENPRNFGVLSKPDLDVTLLNPLCGDKIRITAKIKNKKITETAFEGDGCAISKAGASILMEEVPGKNVKKIQSMSQETFLKLLGIKLTPARMKCALLGLETLKKGLREKNFKN